MCLPPTLQRRNKFEKALGALGEPVLNMLSNMSDEESQMRCARAWQEFACLPKISSARFASETCIVLNTCQLDVVQNKKRAFRTTYAACSSMDIEEHMTTCSFEPLAFPVEVTGVSGSTTSPSGRHLAQIRTEKDKKNSEKTVCSIEILSQGRLEYSIMAPKLHGDIYTSGTFGGLSWSPDETRVAYVAEEIPTKTQSHFEKIISSVTETKENGESNEKKDTILTGEEFVYHPSWGSNLTKVRCPKIFVLDVKSRKIQEVKGTPENVSASEVIWTPDGKGLVFTGYTEPHLGIYAYNTRPSKLYHIRAPPRIELTSKKSLSDEKKSFADDKPSTPDDTADTPQAEILTPDDHSAKFASFSPDGRHLVWFTTNDLEVHASGLKLRELSWRDRGLSRTVVDIVENPKSVNEFPGFYFFDGPPERCWSDNRHMYVTTFWRSNEVVVQVDIKTGTVTRIPFPKTLETFLNLEQHGHLQSSLLQTEDTPLNESQKNRGQMKVLDVFQHFLLCECSDPVTPSSMWVFDARKISPFSWRRVNEHAMIPELEDLSWQLLQIKPTKFDGDEEREKCERDELFLDFESVLVLPKPSDSKPPLVLIPHGGPHSVYGSWFNYYGAAYLASLGFACLAINYRSSLGFGEYMLQSVLGNGLDTMDCIDACNTVLAMEPKIVNSSHLGVIGASHGGYLSTMLSGKFPDMFNVFVAHNPVVNISAMSAMTDIPDWCYVETGLPYSTPEDAIPTTARYKAMFENSPIAHVGNVKAPILFLIGGADTRVPPLQSFDMYNILKKRGVETKLLYYAKGQHALADTVEMSGDYAVNTALWLSKHI